MHFFIFRVLPVGGFTIILINFKNTYSFADDPGLSRGIVAGRAVPSLRSPEIHPPTLASVPPRSGTPPRGPHAGESGTPRAGRQKREGRGKRGRSGSPIKCPPPAPRLPSAPRGPWARDPVPLQRPPPPPPRSTPALCPARALGAGPGVLEKILKALH